MVLSVKEVLEMLLRRTDLVELRRLERGNVILAVGGYLFIFNLKEYIGPFSIRGMLQEPALSLGIQILRLRLGRRRGDCREHNGYSQ